VKWIGLKKSISRLLNKLLNGLSIKKDQKLASNVYQVALNHNM